MSKKTEQYVSTASGLAKKSEVPRLQEKAEVTRQTVSEILDILVKKGLPIREARHILDKTRILLDQSHVQSCDIESIRWDWWNIPASN
jgi:argininosuccinate lyase